MTAAASAESSSRTLASLLDAGARYPEISAHLDALPSERRLAEVLAVTGSGVGKLYAAVQGSPRFTLDELIPRGTADGATVILEGRNSLPSFSRFQKRFCRQNGVIVGYNHQSMSFVTGPGYFVVTDGDDTHPGEMLFDYTLEPPFVPEGWPTYKHNEKGLSRLVYANMKDYCRKVAGGVLVGEAFKKGKSEKAFFTLTLP